MTAQEQKKAAALAALDYVKPGMSIGLGTGSTALEFIDALAERVKGGLDVKCVPTSAATARRAKDAGLTLTTLDATPLLDLAVDGTDEFDADLSLIKGGGGALLLEKIVATSAKTVVIVADASKQVKKLGAFALPVEVVPFGVKATAWKINRVLEICGLSGKMVLRGTEGKPFRTDGGHTIIDVAIGAIPDPLRLSNYLYSVPGVVEHGLFIGVASVVLMGTDNGVKTLSRKGKS